MSPGERLAAVGALTSGEYQLDLWDYPQLTRGDVVAITLNGETRDYIVRDVHPDLEGPGATYDLEPTG